LPHLPKKWPASNWNPFRQDPLLQKSLVRVGDSLYRSFGLICASAMSAAQRAI
jgi:hypothetical protein